MKCPKCKSELQPGAENCARCGTPAKKAKTAVLLRVIGILVFVVLFITAIVIYVVHNKILNPSAPESGTSTSDEQVTVEKVIYSKNGIKVTYLYFEPAASTPRFVFRIENSSICNIYVSTSDVSVNDTMISTSLFSKVNAGKRATDYLYVSKDELYENGIADITQLEFKLEISDADEESDSPVNDTAVVVIDF